MAKFKLLKGKSFPKIDDWCNYFHFYALCRLDFSIGAEGFGCWLRLLKQVPCDGQILHDCDPCICFSHIPGNTIRYG